MLRKSLLYTMILGFLISSVLVPSSIAQSSNYSLSGKELEQKLMTRFTYIFYSELDRAGAYISYGSWNIVGNILRNGAKNLAASPPTLAKINEAEVNVVRLAMAAVTLGKKLPSGEIRLGESTWANIRNRICPLWPFC